MTEGDGSEVEKGKVNVKVFAVGDHVFCWCSWGGLPFAYQQHGIVVEANRADESIVIVNFDYEEDEPDRANGGDKTEEDDETEETSTETNDDNTAKQDSFSDQEEKKEDFEESEKIKSGNGQINGDVISGVADEGLDSEQKPKSEQLQEQTKKEMQDPEETTENPLQKALYGWFNRNTDQAKEKTSQKADSRGSGETVSTPKPEDSTADSKSSDHDIRTQKKPDSNPVQNAFSQFFQKRNHNTDENGIETKLDGHKQDEKTLQKSESALTALFASVPDDRPCTMTRQVIPKEEAQERWEHVQYASQWHKRLISRAGTCSPLEPHPTAAVMTRIRFLQENEEVLSAINYHHHRANGESIAAWCKAGQYISFQGTAKMGKPGLHVASFGMAAEYAGIWGGQIVAGILFPPAIPFLAAYDIYDVMQYGHTFHQTHHLGKEWEERTKDWNEKFSKYVAENQEVVEEVQEAFLKTEQEVGSTAGEPGTTELNASQVATSETKPTTGISAQAT